MNIIPILASIQAPGGLWSTLINWFQSGIGNFGWTILIVTILVKLVTSPLEFLTKLNTKKQNLIQQKCAPQVAKIKKKYGKDQETVKIQTNSLYKREGLNAGSGCVIMLVNMVLTLVIFFTFYSSLRTLAAYQAINQYEILEDTYKEKVVSLLKDKNSSIEGYNIIDEESATLFVNDFEKGKELYEQSQQAENTPSELSEDNDQTESENTSDEESSENTKTDEEYISVYLSNKALVEETITLSSNAIVEKWNEIKSSWLWITNIWVSDAPIYPFLTYDNLVKLASSGGKAYTSYVSENISREDFTAISEVVNIQGGVKNNGFFTLAILAAVITFLSQYITERHTKLKNKKAKQVANFSMEESMNYSMKIMKFIMPVIMVLFVLQSSASFGIYILASNVSAIAFGEISNLIITKLTYKKQKEVEEYLEKEANRLIKKGKLQEKKQK